MFVCKTILANLTFLAISFVNLYKLDVSIQKVQLVPAYAMI